MATCLASASVPMRPQRTASTLAGAARQTAPEGVVSAASAAGVAMAAAEARWQRCLPSGCTTRVDDCNHGDGGGDCGGGGGSGGGLATAVHHGKQEAGTKSGASGGVATGGAARALAKGAGHAAAEDAELCGRNGGAGSYPGGLSGSEEPSGNLSRLVVFGVLSFVATGDQTFAPLLAHATPFSLSVERARPTVLCISGCAPQRAYGVGSTFRIATLPLA